MRRLELNKLAIVIVTFNGGDILQRCLQSIKEASKGMSLEVWLVDNGSSDGSIETAKKSFPNFRYIVNRENAGFAKANNIALRQITTENVLVLNPDTEVSEQALQTMVNYLNSHPEVGAASCKVVLPDGSLDLASHRGFPTPWASLLYYLFKNDRLYHLTNRDFSQEHEVDSITGAFFMTRKSVLDKVGYFDEDYFMYAEDIDLCYRIKQAGYKVMYVPTVEIIHHKGIASGIKAHSQTVTTASRYARQKAFNSFYETMKIFYRKHLASQYPFFINWLVILGINLKWTLAKRKLQV